MKNTSKNILLAHGGGGQLSEELIRNTILPRLGQKSQAKLPDSASLEIDGQKICFTTDSYVVKPLFFSGGDIGKLAVCGTANDLAVSGAKPLALSLSFIIEDQLPFETLEKVLDSIAQTANENDIGIVTGDTKTVESGSADKLFINTSGIGTMYDGVELAFGRIAKGDKIVLSGSIGDHGMTILSQREDIKFDTPLKSDCACLSGLIGEILTAGCDVKFMRDPTRGGLAATLNEIAHETNLNIEIRQDKIPIHPTVRAAADMLGFDVLTIANEGKFVAVVKPDDTQKVLDICRRHQLGSEAQIIGEAMENEYDSAVVELVTSIGTKRIVQMPYGRELPRIC